MEAVVPLLIDNPNEYVEHCLALHVRIKGQSQFCDRFCSIGSDSTASLYSKDYEFNRSFISRNPIEIHWL